MSFYRDPSIKYTIAKLNNKTICKFTGVFCNKIGIDECEFSKSNRSLSFMNIKLLAWRRVRTCMDLTGTKSGYCSRVSQSKLNVNLLYNAIVLFGNRYGP